MARAYNIRVVLVDGKPIAAFTVRGEHDWYMERNGLLGKENVETVILRDGGR